MLTNLDPTFKPKLFKEVQNPETVFEIETNQNDENGFFVYLNGYS